MGTENENENENGYVYVIKVLNYYKIGKTVNPKQRFYEYSRLMEFPEIIFCTFVEDFSKVESKLHKLFKEKCTRGEWFHLENSDLEFIHHVLEKYRVYDDKVLSLEEIIKIHEKREEFINNINNDKYKYKYKKKNNKFKIKKKQETNKVANKKILKNENNSINKKEEEIIKKHNEIKNKIVIGNIYTYKQLCKIFNIKPTDGNSKKSQLKEWERHIKWTKPTSQKYLITEVYDTPKEKTDGRKNNGGAREGAGRKSKIKNIKDQNYAKERRENESE